MQMNLYEHTRLHTFSLKIRSSGAALVCLVLMCVLLLTAVIVLCVQVFTNIDLDQVLTRNTNLTDERDQLLTKITNLVEEKDKLLDKNINVTKIEWDELISKNINLSKQREQFIQESNELWKSLNEKGNLELQLNTITKNKFIKSLFLYFISSEWKSWTESRRYCTERGADLIIINNREEQEFINKISGGAGVWIGLTDSDVEGRWKWVDGTNMTSGFRFWVSGEPNGHRLKNCAVSYSSGWYDYQCNNGPYKWICEKSFVKYHIP
uniref:C-type lectin domain-containing protein n=1 Tax=Sinocyclocheilus grahami TaxID=75366 RepID=A0A672QAC4_SINGR